MLQGVAAQFTDTGRCTSCAIVGSSSEDRRFELTQSLCARNACAWYAKGRIVIIVWLPA